MVRKITYKKNAKWSRGPAEALRGFKRACFLAGFLRERSISCANLYID